MWVQFLEVKLQQIPREENGREDELVQLANSLIEWASRDPLYLEAGSTPSSLGVVDITLVIQNEENINLEEGRRMPDWRTKMEAYLKEGASPSDPKSASRVIGRAKHFIVLDGVLFKKLYGRPLLQYLGLEEAEEVLQEIHEVCYGNHLGSQVLA